MRLSFVFLSRRLRIALPLKYVGHKIKYLVKYLVSPRRRFVFQTEISGKSLYIVLTLISRLFYFLFSLRRGDQSTVSCIVVDFN